LRGQGAELERIREGSTVPGTLKNVVVNDTKSTQMCGSFGCRPTNFSLSSHSFFAVAGFLAALARVCSYTIKKVT
jgi:hypothetical protein